MQRKLPFPRSPILFAKSNIENIIDLYLVRLDYADFMTERFKEEMVDKIQVQHANKDFLAKRWANIKNSSLAYHRNPDSPATQFCLQKAKKSLNFDDKEHDIIQCLMPENCNDSDLSDDEYITISDEKTTSEIKVSLNFCSTQELIKRFENKDKALKDFFKDIAAIKDQEISDQYFAELWRYLNYMQKSFLVEFLENDRLEKILQHRPNPQKQLEFAIQSLCDEIKFAGGEKENPLAADVLNKIIANRDNLKESVVLTELAYRTAVGVRDPFNIKNLERHEMIANKIAEPSLSITARKFSGLLLLGAMAALICVATGGIGGVVGGLCVAGIALSGMLGTGFMVSGVLTGKRKESYKATGVAALGFLRNKRIGAVDNSHRQPQVAARQSHH